MRHWLFMVLAACASNGSNAHEMRQCDSAAWDSTATSATQYDKCETPCVEPAATMTGPECLGHADLYNVANAPVDCKTTIQYDGLIGCCVQVLTSDTTANVQFVECDANR